MRKKSLSTLGFIMDKLNIPTVSMSKNIHVDASLVSKWKTGGRILSPKSVYFDDIIDYILDISSNDDYANLKTALIDLYPQENIDDDTDFEIFLRQALSNNKSSNTTKEEHLLFDTSKTTTISIFNENAGKREAITKLLDFAEKMTEPGEMLFIDSEEFEWLLENTDFSDEFSLRIENLLNRGFHAKFVIHYSSYKERFVKFFNACNTLIFHRNVEWYYYEYYDEMLFNFSFFILNKAISLMGLSASEADSTIMVFTDHASVIHHEMLARHVIEKCDLLFTNFETSQIMEVIDDVMGSHRKGSLYSFMPAPVFAASPKELLNNLLFSNNVNDSYNIQNCLEINAKLSKITQNYYKEKEIYKENFIHIYHLEELVKRAHNTNLISNSLSLTAKKPILVTPSQYACELRHLADIIDKYKNIKIYLLSEKDSVSLPQINCWCKHNSWMVQMDNDGFRLCDESIIVNAASTVIERCIRKIPPERKNPETVKQFLLDLADEIDV